MASKSISSFRRTGRGFCSPVQGEFLRVLFNDIIKEGGKKEVDEEG
jgi:hypothetical protein